MKKFKPFIFIYFSFYIPIIFLNSSSFLNRSVRGMIYPLGQAAGEALVSSLFVYWLYWLVRPLFKKKKETSSDTPLVLNSRKRGENTPLSQASKKPLHCEFENDDVGGSETEDDLYEKAFAEFESGGYHRPTYARAIVESCGDKSKEMYLYIKLRVDSLTKAIDN